MAEDFNKDGMANTLIVAIGICLVCSIVVAGSAVGLRPLQMANKELDRKQNILRAAGMLGADATVAEDGRGVEDLFAEFEVRAVSLDTGVYMDDVDTALYDPIKAAKQDDASRELGPQEDRATLGRRENVSLVYLRRRDGALDKVVIPVRGYGLWGTLFGYLALEGDLNTVAGIGFYEHKETPGLGGEVDNTGWKAGWSGTRVFTADGTPSINLVKTRSPETSSAAAHEVDALSGATLTSRGIENLINFWTGELGFGPYLQRLKFESAQAQINPRRER
ncbi:MAG: Na(+)-translocating NADH-quinone reductase subunit C [Pseudomonadales bacterium]|mgnify:CR=1 FL=1|nr:Na(+)-translocating NADH-quinone reductase subunit C [Pseudomonadales bacterium]MDP6471363.1 Na(+)-translocating NADH-quinone reductase subunit C [Pseudomonadales bacterium]MDP6826445.1 Na(+)-translocating NADH-quinone reductase subunit C [Pseudomonadales bacterium]MDP6970998.1 Na(+)-translocating NADH-quinone reductase subunit C [Pseudomonadales bacterium]